MHEIFILIKESIDFDLRFTLGSALFLGRSHPKQMIFYNFVSMGGLSRERHLINSARLGRSISDLADDGNLVKKFPRKFVIEVYLIGEGYCVFKSRKKARRRFLWKKSPFPSVVTTADR